MNEPEDERAAGSASEKPSWRREGAPGPSPKPPGAAASPFRRAARLDSTSLEPGALPLEEPGDEEAEEAAEPNAESEAVPLDRTLIQPGPSASAVTPPSSAPEIAVGEGTLILPSGAPHPDQPTIAGVSIRREIGRGGMGIVFEGAQGYLDRRVAVKVLINIGTGDEYTRRFQREAKILASLSHPNIVGCYQAGVTEDGRCFLVMEYIDGPTLGEWIETNAPLQPAEALRVCHAVAEALACAFKSGIIHRDVKPPNVLLKSSPDAPDAFPFRPMLADLGLARTSGPMNATGGGTLQELTVQGTVMGSPPTMAPEQFDDPDAVDFRTDIYGLGCVLFHCLTGKLAFPQNSLTSLIARKAQGPPPDPAEFEKGVPGELAKLVRDMLQPDRDERPSSYEELLERISSALQAAPPRRSNATWKVAGVLALLVVGWFAFRALGARSARDQANGEAQAQPREVASSGSGAQREPAVAPPIVLDPPDEPEPEPEPVVIEHEPEPEPEPEPIVIESEPEPAKFVLPELPPITQGETWTLLNASFEGLPLEDWQVEVGTREAWSPLDDGNGAQALLFAGASAARRELPAPPWTLSGTCELKRPGGSSEPDFMIVVVLGGNSGLAFHQQRVGDEIRLRGSLVGPSAEGGWEAGDEISGLSIGSIPLAEYRDKTPVAIEVVWDAEALVLVWKTTDGTVGTSRWSIEDLEGLGAPIGLGLQLSGGAAVVHDLVVVGR